MKKCIILVTSFIMMLCFSFGGTASANSILKNENIEKYGAWINEKIETADGTEKEDFEETLQAFKRLPAEDQEKFVEYMYNPVLQEEIVTEFLSIEPGETKQLRDGDITIAGHPGLSGEDSFDLTSEGYAPSGYAIRKGTYNRWVKMLGIKVFQTTSWVKYTHDNTTMKEVISCNHFTSKNLAPTLATSYSLCDKTLGTKTATSTSDITFSFIWEGLGIIMGTGELGVQGNVNGKVTGWYIPYD